MRRVPYLIPLLALMLVVLLVVPGLNGRAAQEGTPAAGAELRWRE